MLIRLSSMANFQLFTAQLNLSHTALNTLNQLKTLTIKDSMHQFILNHQMHLLWNSAMQPVAVVVHRDTLNVLVKINQLFQHQRFVIIQQLRKTGIQRGWLIG